MPFLSLSGSCDEGANVCEWTLEATGNQQLANLADWLVGKPLALAGLALFGLVVRWLLHKLIDRIVSSAETPMSERMARGTVAEKLGGKFPDSPGGTRRVQRAQTIGSLLKSIVSGVVAAIVLTMMLSELGANIGPIIASAGILGVALGFGAQSLVKDFLSGIFMIFEDQYGVGDMVDLGTTSGTVEAVSLRVTRLRDVNGTVWYVRNGEILRVGNKSQNWARTVLDVSVPFGEDLVKVRRVLGEVAGDLWRDDDWSGLVIEQPEVLGVQAFDSNGVVVRVTMKTAPSEQFRIGRALRERVIARFDHEGIEMFTTPRVSAAAADDGEGPVPHEE
ncbi:MAG: mechanosensitive ion channel family protein [Nocardioides sp.]|uniref:mechanosensitive ion channel family protein n=1 Tax=Nocardioides sp. TaxID=35761 RepID=UPI003F0A0DDF